MQYDQSSVTELEPWMHHMIRRGYFFVLVRLLDGRRVMDWMSFN